MEEITIEQVKQVIEERRIDHFSLRKCSICDHTLQYIIDRVEDEVYYDASCECTDHYDLQPRSWNEFLSTFNRQTPEIRAKMWERFITMSPPT